MDTGPRHGRALAPLAYHHDVVAFLKLHEPETWAWAASLGAQEQHAQSVREQLLRDTYRLSPESHPLPHQACALAMERLGLQVPATIYQAGGDGSINAMLCHLPDHAHVVLQGPVLDRLGEDELLALFGHELSHHRLWSEQGGDFLVADRILNHTLSDPGAAASHVETARLYSLHTELYADRGAALAAGAAAPAVGLLVKVHTGIASVDANAYLEQAREIERSDSGTARGHSHPETFLRAQALDLWWQQHPDAEAWVRRRLQGPLRIESLDLTAQLRLTALTRGFLSHYFSDAGLRSERLLTQAREFFPDWSPDQAAAAAADLGPEAIGDSVRDFLHSVMLDLALSDDDLREAALRRATVVADGLGSRDAFLKRLARDAGLGKRELDKLVRQLPKGADA